MNHHDLVVVIKIGQFLHQKASTDSAKPLWEVCVVFMLRSPALEGNMFDAGKTTDTLWHIRLVLQG